MDERGYAGQFCHREVGYPGNDLLYGFKTARNVLMVLFITCHPP